jgi:hypothetical protein
MTDTNSKSERVSRRRYSPAIFLYVLLIALASDLLVLPRLAASLAKSGPDKNPFYVLGEHLTIALFVASALGLTYEVLLAKQREEAVRRLIHGLYLDLEKMFLAIIQKLTLTNIDQIFWLLRDIVAQAEKTPTLFNPPRNANAEYSFASNMQYFDALVATRRQDVIEALRGWIRAPESPPNIRFLASDFVGNYLLAELAEELRAAVRPKIALWSEVSGMDKAWVLNYVWAYSRCESPRYKSLADLLLRDDDGFTHKWILFVPLQMPDAEFIPVLDRYISSSTFVERNSAQVKLALANLIQQGHEQARVVMSRLPSGTQAAHA